MKKRPSFRLAIGILFIIYIVYFFVLSVPPPEYDRIEVENYMLNDANSFSTTPFYTKSTHVRRSSDVTLITQVSVDRLSRIQDMVESWNAPISVAVYVKQKNELSKIDQLYDSSESLRTFVDFHILYANKTRYPVNNLRNLALTNARTSMVMILDADFVTSGDMHDYLSSFGRELKSKQKLAYVVPAFSSDLRASNLPKNKEKLLGAIEKKTVNEYEGPCPKCHGPTNYKKWLKATEPYDIHFDERLKGYGFDKNTHVSTTHIIFILKIVDKSNTYTLAVAGYKFVVLPEPFVIHLNHPEAAWDGPSIQEQLWDALQYVCAIIPAAKHKYGYSPNQQLFGEPVGNVSCFSRDHW